MHCIRDKGTARKGSSTTETKVENTNEYIKMFMDIFQNKQHVFVAKIIEKKEKYDL